MNFILSKDQKKSFLLTVLLYGILLLILFFVRFWPPSNLAELTGGGGGGVSVNFGDSDLGSGSNYKSEVLNVKNQTFTRYSGIPITRLLDIELSKSCFDNQMTQCQDCFNIRNFYVWISNNPYVYFELLDIQIVILT